MPPSTASEPSTSRRPMASSSNTRPATAVITGTASWLLPAACGDSPRSAAYHTA